MSKWIVDRINYEGYGYVQVYLRRTMSKEISKGVVESWAENREVTIELGDLKNKTFEEVLAMEFDRQHADIGILSSVSDKYVGKEVELKD